MMTKDIEDRVSEMIRMAYNVNSETVNEYLNIKGMNKNSGDITLRDIYLMDKDSIQMRKDLFYLDRKMKIERIKTLIKNLDK